MSEALIVGAGQAGLAMARALAERGIPARMVDGRSAVGGAWGDYYESLRLFSPVRYSALPGLTFPGPPNHYPGAKEVSAYLKSYAEQIDVPKTLGDRVEAISPAKGGFEAHLASGAKLLARAVVVATGTFGSPHMPTIPGQDQFAGARLHACAYRRPDAFAGQRVIVVGAANSAVQIAFDLLKHAVSVTLAVREPVRYVPQRMLGRDIHFWFNLLGIDRAKWLSDQGTPVIDDGRYRAAIRDGAIEQRAMFVAFDERGVVWPNGSRSDADAVIFATGYKPDIGFLKDWPMFGATNKLDQRNGVARRAAGIFFLGQPGLRSFASGTLRGVAYDAPIVARNVQAFLAQRGEPVVKQ